MPLSELDEINCKLRLFQLQNQKQLIEKGILEPCEGYTDKLPITERTHKFLEKTIVVVDNQFYRIMECVYCRKIRRLPVKEVKFNE